ncbi:amino acid ABC transporter permease [Staphylococcus auricularis]|uniref:Amino acid ABC transporter permease n=1 Tax=Staphylococcus auricularis TaxID=29379 RepID=A0ABX5IGS6_9STAP|nr:amino acid ABC transporter permease [Staphylococcus auricularis]MCE5038641.1 amino acid ABC transporter permease [Staphylococcus auricularis]MEB6570118.1 amino acid ABC transporter permease [Staphylococcus auricularis]PTH19364.1 amino acid ABC transporter permease [Staphylococcus auricularis]PTH26421.1 amino acid ABC transporter permease [Staphylococcus auricularis]
MTHTNWIDLFQQVLQQLPLTLVMIVLSLIFAFILGFFLAVIRIKQTKVLAPLVRLYISFMRSTPLVLQLFLVYFALPQLLLFVHIDINHFSRLFFVILAFSLHSAAYLCEIMRAGYLSVPYAQIEAGLSVGLSYPRILKDIVIPQALRNSIPNVTTQIIELIKDTSLAFTIGIIDIMGQVQLIIGNNYGLGMFQVYVVIAMIYWALALIVQGVFTVIYKRAERPYQV